MKDERAPDAAATENIDSSGVQSKEALKVFAALDGESRIMIIIIF